MSSKIHISDNTFNFIELKKAKSTIKVLNMIDEAVFFIASNHPNITKVGVLSTTGTYKSLIYSTLLSSKGYEVIVPSLEMQEKMIHPAIYDPIYGIKAKSNGIHPKAKENLLQGISYLKKQGAQAVILGCTEMPLAITETKINNIVILDPTNILARALIYQYNPSKLVPL